MVTREGFDRYVEDWAKEGVPFMAYWWPKGYSIIRTGTWTEPAHIENHRPVREKQRKVPQSVLNKWTRLRDKLRRSGCYMVTVEFDGQHLTVEE